MAEQTDRQTDGQTDGQTDRQIHGTHLVRIVHGRGDGDAAVHLGVPVIVGVGATTATAAAGPAGPAGEKRRSGVWSDAHPRLMLRGRWRRRRRRWQEVRRVAARGCRGGVVIVVIVLLMGGRGGRGVMVVVMVVRQWVRQTTAADAADGLEVRGVCGGRRRRLELRDQIGEVPRGYTALEEGEGDDEVRQQQIRE